MSRIVSPTRESLQMAIELVKIEKYADHPIIAIAGMLDGYLSGIISVDVSFKEDGSPNIEIVEGAERDESVSDGGFRSPTDAELQERGCPDLIESWARRFLCNLPDTDLALIAESLMGAPLRSRLAALAEDELHRRRDL